MEIRRLGVGDAPLAQAVWTSVRSGGTSGVVLHRDSFAEWLACGERLFVAALEAGRHLVEEVKRSPAPAAPRRSGRSPKRGIEPPALYAPAGGEENGTGFTLFAWREPAFRSPKREE